MKAYERNNFRHFDISCNSCAKIGEKKRSFSYNKTISQKFRM